MKISEADYIEWYGVKGMKWGVRKKDDYKATINSMSRAGRALSTLNVYADKKKRLAEKGKKVLVIALIFTLTFSYFSASPFY